MNARLVLARAVTVAIRYLSIRRQFRDRDSVSTSDPEVSVLDYSTVQIRVLPLLATTFALHYSGAAMRELYERTRSTNALDGDRAQLAELHSTSAGLKSLATELAANGVETCRRAMGGHGYGGGTGLIQLNADYLSKPTVEGDNWMITQQVARFLMKKVGDVMAAPHPQSETATGAKLRAHYHGSPGSGNRQPLGDLDDLAGLGRAFEHRVSWLAFQAYDAREVKKRRWNELLVDFHKLSRAYSESMLVSNFWEALNSSLPLSYETRSVMADLYKLYALHTMDADARGFQRSGATTADALDQLQPKILQLMQRIRPHAVKLVDAFTLPDYLLDSALGRYDGRVYEDLFHRAHVLNPLNRITFNPDYRNNEIVLGSGDGGAIVSKL
jgi:acyl-CoA oxidase